MSRLAAWLLFECLRQGRPENKAGWSAWLLSKTDGLTRKQRILDLQPKLSSALQALHTGLLSVQMKCPELTPTSRFSYLEAAAEDAYRLIQEFEFGRLMDGRVLAAGKLHVGSLEPDVHMWQDA